jgi:hypothetical protein
MHTFLAETVQSVGATADPTVTVSAYLTASPPVGLVLMALVAKCHMLAGYAGVDSQGIDGKDF